MIRVADAVRRFLEESGVRAVFSVTGGGSIFLNDALYGASLAKTWFCHHEQAAVMAAEAHARMTGDLGVALVTLGPGATNAVTGVAAAWMDSVPVMVISGQSFSSQTVGSSDLRQVGIQEFPIIPAVQTFTKYAITLTDPSQVLVEFARARAIALEGRPGPVWIEIPADVQAALVEWEELERYEPPVVEEHEVKDRLEHTIRAVDEVVRLLLGSQRPVIQVGYGVRIASAIGAFRELVERHDLPFMTSHNGNDLVASKHPQRIGFPGIFGQRAANFATQNCDLLISIGCRLSLAQTGYNSLDFARNAEIVLIDIDPAELAKGTLQTSLTIEMDAKEFLEAFSRRLPERYRVPAEWVAVVNQWKSKYRVIDEHHSAGVATEYVNSYELASVLSGFLHQDDVIVTDMGLAYQSAHQALEIPDGARFFTNTGLAPMGWGLPAAVGAAVAGIGQRVICLVGDGGFMMNLQELSTVAQHALPIKIFVHNNKGYLTIRQTQENGFDSREIGVDSRSGLGFPDFCVVARGFGIESMTLDATQGWVQNVEAALNHPGPMLIDVQMDPMQMQGPKSLGRPRTSGGRDRPVLEDLWPFLDTEQLANEMLDAPARDGQ